MTCLSISDEQKASQLIKNYSSCIRKTDPELAEDLNAVNDWMQENFAATEKVLEINTKALVYGRPFYLRNDNKIHISADAIYVDNGRDRSYEIRFKEFLIETYKK